MWLLLTDTWYYFLSHQVEMQQALTQHLQLVGLALGLTIVTCVPLGIWTSRSALRAKTVLNLFNSLRVIPSLAVLFLAIPYFGLSLTSALLALTFLAIPPILVNTNTAYRQVDPAVKEAAVGLGMNSWQLLWQVETPLALPLILAGIRTAATEVIASATLAAFIGSGGLGTFVVRGFAMYDLSILLVGAVPVILLTLLVEGVLGQLQRWLTPPQTG